MSILNKVSKKNTDKVALPKGLAKKAAPKATKPATKSTGERKVGVLAAAAKVLAKNPEPRKVGEILGDVIEAGLWKSKKGKTPAATLHAAMSREIRAKGKASRFAKVGRGLFTANKTALKAKAA